MKTEEKRENIEEKKEERMESSGIGGRDFRA